MAAFDGTLILVSHDREFLNGLVNKVYEFKNQKIKEHLGGIYEFLQKRKLENLVELNRKVKPVIDSVSKQTSAIKQDYLEKKEMDKIIRKASQQVVASEQKIESLEKELEEITLLLANPDHIEKSSGEKLYNRHGEVEKLLEKEMSTWERLNTELEQLKEQRF